MTTKTNDLVSTTRTPKKIRQTNFALSVFSENSGQSDSAVLFGGGSDHQDNLGIFGKCKSSRHEHKVLECPDFYNSTVNSRLKLSYEIRACFLCGYNHGRHKYGKNCPNKERAKKSKILCSRCVSEVLSGNREYPYMSLMCNRHAHSSTSVQMVQSLKAYYPQLEVAGMTFNPDLGEDWALPFLKSEYVADELVVSDAKSEVLNLKCSTDK